MPVVMIYRGLARAPIRASDVMIDTFLKGQYLKSYNVEGNDGHGDIVFTCKLSEALYFPTAEAAFVAWHAVPACRPLRPDGRPNKPLTAVTVELVIVTEEMCPGHVASAADPKVCARCGVHIDSLRP